MSTPVLKAPVGAAMSDEDYTGWVAQLRQFGTDALAAAGLTQGRVAAEPTLGSPPLFAIFPVDDAEDPNRMWYWLIAGDLPTDIIPPVANDSMRDVIHRFGQKWLSELASIEGTTFNGLGDSSEQSQAIRQRAQSLIDWAADDGLWNPVQ